LFGFGESDSDNRAHDALTQALKNPLMDRGRLLSDAANILVQVAGGPGMTLSEVEILMNELNRHIGDKTQILFGTAVDGRMGNRLAVTIISSLSAEGEVVTKPVFQRPAAVVAPEPTKHVPEPAAVEPNESSIDEEEPAPEPPVLERPLQTIEAVMSQPEMTSSVEAEPEEDDSEESDSHSQPSAQITPEMIEPEPAQPRVILPKKTPLMPKESKVPVEKIAHAKQEVMQFESVTRGRFERASRRSSKARTSTFQLSCEKTCA